MVVIKATPLLRKWISRPGNTKEKFAKRSGLSRSLIEKVHCGIYVPKKPETIRKMARALRVSQVEMMALVKWEGPHVSAR